MPKTVLFAVIVFYWKYLLSLQTIACTKRQPQCKSTQENLETDWSCWRGFLEQAKDEEKDLILPEKVGGSKVHLLLGIKNTNLKVLEGKGEKKEAIS